MRHACLLALLVAHARAQGPHEIFVDASAGSDTVGNGTANSPFATIARARDELRATRGRQPLATATATATAGGVVVNIGRGVYDLSRGPLEFDARDSGASAAAPVVYRGAGAGLTRLVGGIPLPRSSLGPVPATDPNAGLLRPGVASRVARADLAALGVTTEMVGELRGGPGNGPASCLHKRMEAFAGPRSLTLARYPNLAADGTDRAHGAWLHVAEVENGTRGTFAVPAAAPTGASAPEAGAFARVVEWQRAAGNSTWLHGYWGFDWAENHVHVSRIRTTNDTNGTRALLEIDPGTPPNYPTRPQARWYAENLLQELDAPDEYWIDQHALLLYVLKPAPKSASEDDDELWVSTSDGVLLGANVSDIAFEGMSVQYSRGTGIAFAGGARVRVVDCAVSHHGEHGIAFGNEGQPVRTEVQVAGPVLSPSVLRSSVSEVGCAGVLVAAGAQLPLAGGNATVTDNDVHHYSRWKRTYQPGVGLQSVGGVFARNHLHDAPHFGMEAKFSDGNLYEQNVFERLCQESGDSGAFYTGRSWIDRGNVLRGNTFRDIHNTGDPIRLQKPNTHAIHFDDQMSGHAVLNNTFVNCQAGVRLGGGRDTHISGNAFRNVTCGVHFDNRGMVGAHKGNCTFNLTSMSAPCDATLVGQVQRALASNYSLWARAYPRVAGIPRDLPGVPVDNVIANNSYCSTPLFVDNGHGAPLDAATVAREWRSTIAGNVDHGLCHG
jgi:hypothetical protein